MNSEVSNDTAVLKEDFTIKTFDSLSKFSILIEDIANPYEHALLNVLITPIHSIFIEDSYKVKVILLSYKFVRCKRFPKILNLGSRSQC